MDDFDTDYMDHAPETPRKPRIAFMGEFSAGKSTLTNMLIGSAPLPVKVTATQLPPVWVAYGDQQAYAEDIEGETHPLDLNDIDSISPHDTRVIRIFQQSDILEMCDLIDMPGISDPNMSPDLWLPVAEEADLVVWCTHATQAWRQSEAAMWGEMPPEIQQRSLLLVTRFDKILNDKDRHRVLRRIEHETQGMFAGVYPISLTQAIAAGDDRDMWEASGAEAFMERLVELLHEVDGSAPAAAPRARPGRPDAIAEAVDDRPVAVNAASGERVLPRRVKPGAPVRARSARPGPDEKPSRAFSF